MIWRVLGPVGLFQFCCGSAGGHWSAASDAAGEGGGVEELWIWWRGTAGCCLETMATDYDTTAC